MPVKVSENPYSLAYTSNHLALHTDTGWSLHPVGVGIFKPNFFPEFYAYEYNYQIKHLNFSTWLYVPGTHTTLHRTSQKYRRRKWVCRHIQRCFATQARTSKRVRTFVSNTFVSHGQGKRQIWNILQAGCSSIVQVFAHSRCLLISSLYEYSRYWDRWAVIYYAEMFTEIGTGTRTHCCCRASPVPCTTSGPGRIQCE